MKEQCVYIIRTQGVQISIQIAEVCDVFFLFLFGDSTGFLQFVIFFGVMFY